MFAQSRIPWLIVWICIQAATVLALNRQISEKEIVSKNLIKLVVPKSLIFSPNGVRFACVVKTDKSTYIISDDGGYKLSKVANISSLIFSPGSNRLACVVDKEGKKWIFIEGGTNYRCSNLTDGTLKFSSDGTHIAYLAKDNNMCFAVLGGVAQKKYDEINTNSFCFKPNSNDLAYLAKTGNKWLVVIGGEEQECPAATTQQILKQILEYNNMRTGGEVTSVIKDLIFSPNGQHVAWRTTHYELRFVTQDGFVATNPDQVGFGPTRIINPDGSVSNELPQMSGIEKILGSEKKSETGSDIVRDRNTINKEHRVCTSPVYSPNSKRLAYIAQVSGKLCVIIDGVESQHYDKMTDTLIFSPNSNHLAFIAQIGSLKALFVDGEQHGMYPSIAAPIFSPNSEHVAYIGCLDNRRAVVLDKKQGQLYDKITGISFSPDSKHIAYVAHTDKKCCVVVNEDEGKKFDSIAGNVFFNSPSSISYFAVKDMALFKIDETFNND